MRQARPATEDEVILAFLRGELDSPRFGDAIRDALETGGGIPLVSCADTASLQENEARRRALASTRGWATGAGLFAGFPADVTWTHGLLEHEELDRVRFIDYSYWVELSGGSRWPVEVVPTLRAGRLPAWMKDLGTDWCFQLAQTVGERSALDDLIIVGTPDLDRLVVLEGHARLTALFVAGLQHELDVSAYVGTSANIESWALF